jgi:hypothetical protein
MRLQGQEFFGSGFGREQEFCVQGRPNVVGIRVPVHRQKRWGMVKLAPQVRQIKTGGLPPYDLHGNCDIPYDRVGCFQHLFGVGQIDDHKTR